MLYKEVHEFDISTFPWWSGAREVYDKLDDEQAFKAEALIESVFGNKEPTDEELNDFMWFDVMDMLDEI